MEDATNSHYNRLAKSYDDNWVHNPGHIRWMTRHILSRLKIAPGEQVADIGCGTGLYSKGLAERADQVLCIDPSAEMLRQLPQAEAFIPIQATAEEVASGDVQLPYKRFDAILMKEALHHVNDRVAVLRGLTHMLTPGGRLLVVMLPTRIDYPLFRAALDLFERLQPDPAEVANAMRTSNLQVDMQYESFELSIDKARYIAMVKVRYMSLLSSFDDTALNRGIAEIDARHSGDTLSFVDRQAFVLGKRRAG